MKNSVFNYLALALLCCFTHSLKSATAGVPKQDSLLCLQIEGKITNADAGINGECIVELISLNNLTDTIILKEGKKKFKFLLNKDLSYAIRISKKGYTSKLISVNTEILTGVEGLYKFEFETSLLTTEDTKLLNRDAIDFPVAIICYDYDRKYFSYDKDYSNSIKKELYKKMAPRKSSKQFINNEVTVSK